MEINYVRPDNNQHSAPCCPTAIEHETAGSSYARPDPYNDGLTIAHLKPFLIVSEVLTDMTVDDEGQAA